MIKSEVKKKIEANATITNTMIVVIVVSRRVGQVTLAVSERTSCRNLNGLKAIVGYPRPLRRMFDLSDSEQPSSAQPSLQGCAPLRAPHFGGIQSRAGYRHFNGPAAGGGYLLPVGQK